MHLKEVVHKYDINPTKDLDMEDLVKKLFENLGSINRGFNLEEQPYIRQTDGSYKGIVERFDTLYDIKIASHGKEFEVTYVPTPADTLETLLSDVKRIEDSIKEVFERK